MQSSGKVLVTLCLTGILSISMLTLAAQNQATVLESLQAKKWEIQGMTDKTAETHYQADLYTVYLNGMILGKFNYYLSDSIDESFDRTKIGKIPNGKYIVTQLIPDSNFTKRTIPMSVYEIIQLDKNSLILRYTKQTNLLKYKAKEDR